MMSYVTRWAAAWMVLVATSAMAFGQTDENGADRIDALAAVNGWYAMMAPGQTVEAMSRRADALLAADARIEIVDLEVEQNRQEFIESLDEWVDAIDGGTIAHRAEPGFTAQNVTVLVCFRFVDNELLSRERFTLSDDRIVAAVFETVADTCQQL